MIRARTSAPTPNWGQPPSTVMRWLVFIILVSMVSVSRGRMVRMLITYRRKHRHFKLLFNKLIEINVKCEQILWIKCVFLKNCILNQSNVRKWHLKPFRAERMMSYLTFDTLFGQDSSSVETQGDHPGMGHHSDVISYSTPPILICTSTQTNDSQVVIDCSSNKSD